MTRRWGFVLETVGWGKPRKVGDILVDSTRADDVRRWLGPSADVLAAMIVTSLADVVRAGWNTDWLRWIAGVLDQWGFVSRVYEHVAARSPPERVAGVARVGPVDVAPTTVRQMIAAGPQVPTRTVVPTAAVPPPPPPPPPPPARAPVLTMTDLNSTNAAARVGRVHWE